MPQDEHPDEWKATSRGPGSRSAIIHGVPKDPRRELGLPRGHEKLRGLLVAQASQALAEQALVVDAGVWHQRGGRDAFVFEVLASMYGEPAAWDYTTIAGEPAVSAVRRLNDTVHTLARSRGAARWKAAVAAEQGGLYCATCGARDDLHVDHIVPVSRGGSETALKNMQLLCATCNTAKRELDAELLPSVLTTSRTATVTPRLSYKRIQLDAVAVGPRRIGRCRCGLSAGETHLRVEAPPFMAANLIGLVILCELCEGR